MTYVYMQQYGRKNNRQRRTNVHILPTNALYIHAHVPRWPEKSWRTRRLRPDHCWWSPSFSSSAASLVPSPSRSLSSRNARLPTNQRENLTVTLCYKRWPTAGPRYGIHPSHSDLPVSRTREETKPSFFFVGGGHCKLALLYLSPCFVCRSDLT